MSESPRDVGVEAGLGWDQVEKGEDVLCEVGSSAFLAL